MEVVIFTGPTLPADAAREHLSATYFPPAAQGDVYRVARESPLVIGLIDGHFDHVPAVWHKEILWAMQQGIHVFGSASMGALRAAELSHFGMEGVGRIFEAYRDGVLEDDDEVAILHGPPETNYASATEAMVNIRTTLRRAVEADVLDDQVAKSMEALGKSLFYQQRTYSRIIASARDAELPSKQIDAFQTWVREAAVDSKKEDAVEMLQTIRQRLDQGLPPKQVDYRMEEPSFWKQAVDVADASESHEYGKQKHLSQDAVIEELRVSGRPFLEACQHALLRMFAIKYRGPIQLGEEELGDAIEDFFQLRGINSEQARSDWMEENRISADSLKRLVQDESLIEELLDEHLELLGRYLLDHLRVSGTFSKYAKRAEEKQELVPKSSVRSPKEHGLSKGAVIRWFLQKTGASAAELDLIREQLGYHTPELFLQAVLRDYLHEQTLAQRNEAP